MTRLAALCTLLLFLFGCSFGITANGLTTALGEGVHETCAGDAVVDASDGSVTCDAGYTRAEGGQISTAFSAVLGGLLGLVQSAAAQFGLAESAPPEVNVTVEVPSAPAPEPPPTP